LCHYPKKPTKFIHYLVFGVIFMAQKMYDFQYIF